MQSQRSVCQRTSCVCCARMSQFRSLCGVQTTHFIRHLWKSLSQMCLDPSPVRLFDLWKISVCTHSHSLNCPPLTHTLSRFLSLSLSLSLTHAHTHTHTHTHSSTPQIMMQSHTCTHAHTCMCAHTHTHTLKLIHTHTLTNTSCLFVNICNKILCKLV